MTSHAISLDGARPVAEEGSIVTGDGERIALSRLLELLASHSRAVCLDLVRIELRANLGRVPSEGELWHGFSERHPVSAAEVIENASRYLRVRGRRFEAQLLERCVDRGMFAAFCDLHPFESRQARWEHFEECHPESALAARRAYDASEAEPATS